MANDPTGFERGTGPGGLVGARSRALVEIGVPHVFTTRRGPAGRELDAGRLSAREREAIRCWAGFEPGARPALARQVHGADVLAVERATEAGSVAADALTTTTATRWIGVVTADCVPILVARTDGEHVAAIHAGWRGLVAGVIPNTLRHLPAGEPVAAVGPCLSLARFEVGSEVARAFVAADLAAVVHRDLGPRPHVDLRAAASLQLERAGVRRIDVSTRCTWDDDELWSHRRDVTHGGAARTGRLGAWIAPRRSSLRASPGTARRPSRRTA